MCAVFLPRRNNREGLIMIHEGAVLITSADITRIDATSLSGRMLMKAPNVLVTSEQTQLTLRGLVCLCMA